jgi:aspartyl-tRNA(Asn)/glutamyl-tRNA(Gln) amidotransferase subunit A
VRPEDVVFAPVRRLGELLRERRLSPVALAETFLDRLERLGPRYNAVVTITRARALEQARRAEGEIAAGRYRGPLHGIPYGAKDLLATSGGIPTTWGAAPFKDRVFDFDATAIRKLEGRARCSAPSSRWWSWPAAWATASPMPPSPDPA